MISRTNIFLRRSAILVEVNSEASDSATDPTAHLVTQAANELYGLLPGEFTSARDARAVVARKSGQRDLAVAIKKLSRPTTSAWLANRLVRQRGAALDQLLALAADLRNAQHLLKANDLRQMSRQRHSLVNDLVRQARTLATSAGVALSASAERELTATLEAAIADEAASEALRAGRLVTALSYSGFGTLTTENGGDDQPTDDQPTDDQSADAARKAKALDEARGSAGQALADAQQLAAQRRSEADEQETRWEAANHQHVGLTATITELEARLASLRLEEAEAARLVGVAEQAQERARRRVEDADKGVDRQQHVLDRLSGGDDPDQANGHPEPTPPAPLD